MTSENGQMRALPRLHEGWQRSVETAMGLEPLSSVWAKGEILLGLIVAVGGLLVLRDHLASDFVGGGLMVLGLYLAAAGHRSHLYQAANRQTAYLAQLVSAIEKDRLAGRQLAVSTARIHDASRLAARAHAGQTRKNGKPYATHPEAVREILVDELGVTDEDAQVAALLHDVYEDSPITLSEIEHQFGSRVADMVATLSKVPEPNEPREAMLRRYYTGLRLAEPIVRQVKVADRIHNLREMSDASPDFQSRYLAETEMLLKDVLADAPGIESLRAEFERSRVTIGAVSAA